MITKHRFDETKLKRVEVRGGEYVDWLQMAIHEPSCSAAFQEFRPDEKLGYWVFWYDQVHFALKGKAKCIYRVPPTYDEEHVLEVGEGDLYLLPIGYQARWEVIGDEPYRTLFVNMPNPKYFAF